MGLDVSCLYRCVSVVGSEDSQSLGEASVSFCLAACVSGCNTQPHVCTL